MHPFEAPHHKADSRETWTSSRHFTLACISFAVGMGNIWRFPSLVYEHNGGAFLIPYFACSFVIGFPMLYLELSLGQFTRMGPAVVYGWIRPFMQGIGWIMVSMSLLVCIYYNMIVAWTIFYLYKIVTGGSYEWGSCRNEFNTPYCSSSLEDNRCLDELLKNENVTVDSAFYFNGSCYPHWDTETADIRRKLFENLSAVSPAEEFFENYVLEKAATVDSFGGLNYKLVFTYFVAWTITALVLFRGVKLMGKVAYFTATVPYIIIIILFIRSVTLDGAIIGMKYYLLEPDFSTVWDPASWRAAATHVSFSLSIGFGGMLSLGSYNHRDHNCYRDALIITLADAAMSLFGGTAVFSVLGFISKQLSLPIDQVVQSGTGLAFVAYPEALSRMPISWLWALLFFFMIWVLGISSQFGYAQCICSAMCDQFNVLRRNQSKTVFAVCGCLYLCGLIMCTRTGIFYFNIFNDYSASFALTFVLFLESILICYIYGCQNYLSDLRYMIGLPVTRLGRIFGPTGKYISFVWRFICPVQALIIFVFSLLTQITYDLTYGKGSRLYVLPRWSVALGWCLSLLPLLWVPIFFIYRVVVFKKSNTSMRELFRLQPEWPTYSERTLKSLPNDQRKLNSTFLKGMNWAGKRRATYYITPTDNYSYANGFTTMSNGTNLDNNSTIHTKQYTKV
ncbi:sodium:neurotransmitter symporter family domain-containing protein [Ditylenchus destructor]|uniref:Sodium:neurotransmitter symporter family domain-containing protein n=1 Tax=Ditylenchus destructor TaxID=166010 RepID=A0AAD4MUA7_9BILA|nr:sodium:neurotransmitter symporter family domain-containing protein [Ditylenchus destructor]